MSNINKHYTKEALSQMLEGVFIQHRDQPHFLVLSDTNVFFDDESGRKLATEQAARSNARIFRFRNPHYAESEESGHIIEDGDGSQQVNNVTSLGEKEEDEDNSDHHKEGDVTEQVTEEVVAVEAKTATTADTRSSKTTKSTGVKAKTATTSSATTTKTTAGVKAKK